MDLTCYLNNKDKCFISLSGPKHKFTSRTKHFQSDNRFSTCNTSTTTLTRARAFNKSAKLSLSPTRVHGRAARGKWNKQSALEFIHFPIAPAREIKAHREALAQSSRAQNRYISSYIAGEKPAAKSVFEPARRHRNKLKSFANKHASQHSRTSHYLCMCIDIYIYIHASRVKPRGRGVERGTSFRYLEITARMLILLDAPHFLPANCAFFLTKKNDHFIKVFN